MLRLLYRASTGITILQQRGRKSSEVKVRVSVIVTVKARPKLGAGLVLAFGLLLAVRTENYTISSCVEKAPR